MKSTFKFAAVALVAAFAGAAQAGPFIISGTDADDHGYASGGTNYQGWSFMQKALENIGAGVTNGNKVVYSLGSNVGTQAGNAASSAFGLSTLAGTGWSFQSINGAANINSFFAGPSVAGIIMLDSGSNVSGGLDSFEEAALTSNASALNNFVGSGGGLFSQANSYGWLTALIPGITFGGYGDQGLALTAAGNAAFPGLTNADLSSGPYHGDFTNIGSLPVLAKGTGYSSNLNVILGASGGSITVPVTSVPEPETFAMLLAGLGLMGAVARRRKAK